MALTQKEINQRKIKEIQDQEQEMLDQLNEISKEKSRITASEFAKFEPLYRNRDKAPSVISQEAFELRDLSNEFLQRINPFKPFDVVDDSDPSKVLYTLPAIYCEVGLVTTEQRLTNMQDHTNFSRSQLPHHQDIATAHAVTAIIRSQDKEKLLSQRREFIELDKKFAQLKSGITPSENTTGTPSPNEEASINLEFD